MDEGWQIGNWNVCGIAHIQESQLGQIVCGEDEAIESFRGIQ